MYNKEINELLEIEKKVLKIYNKLIDCKINNNKEEYKKQFNNLNILLEYEDEKIDNFIKITDEKMIDFYLDYNRFDFNMFNSEILEKDDLFKYRLTKILINKNNVGIYNNMDTNSKYTYAINDILSEEHIKYIWDINDSINDENKDKIIKIQYYICYLDKTIENFFLDNNFNFNKKYEDIRFVNYDKSDYLFRSMQIDRLDNQLTFLLNQVLKILQTNPKSEEYMYYKSFIRSVTESVGKVEFKEYIQEIKETNPNKLMLLFKVMGD